MKFRISPLKTLTAALAIVVAVPTMAYATHTFPDVPTAKFYHDAVEWAFANGITTGTSPTTFSPEDPVTRGENITFAKRYDDNVVQPALATKADASAVYTQAEVDALLAVKADAADVPEASVASASSAPALALTASNQTVLTANISTSGTASLLVSAAVEVNTDGGDNDNVNCNLSVDGTDGLRQSISIPDAAFSNQAVLTMTQVFPVAAGTHTVIVECSEGGTSNTTVESASLVILAID